MNKIKKYLILSLVCAAALAAVPSPGGAAGPRQAEVDSLMLAASARLEARDGKGAVALFEEVVRIDPNHAPAHRMLGAIWLGANRIEEAEAAYERARRIDNSADSWFGLGMTAAAGDRNRKKEAVKRFRKALDRDPKMADARYQLALVLYSLRQRNAEEEMERVVETDPDYVEAYVALSRWAEQRSDRDEAMSWCERGLKVKPDDPGLRIRKAELQVAAGDQDVAVEELISLLKLRPHEVRALPIIAQAHLAKGRLGASEEAFHAYLDRVSPQERAYYEDISLVSAPEESRAFQALPPEMGPEFLRQFWARRDVDLIGGVNRRRLEHYRRVWVARTEFSQGRTPWDRRGETYIRYGDPDFRQRDGDPNYEEAMDPKVRAVRERTATRLYGAALATGDDRGLHAVLRVLSGTGNTNPIDASSKINYGGSMSSLPADTTGLAIPSYATDSPDFQRPGEVPLDVGLLRGPAYPMQAAGAGYTIVAAGGTASVPWESWIYIQIGGGTEFVFTDDFSTGAYDFAPIPALQVASSALTGTGLGSGFSSRLREYSPEEVFRTVKTEAPTLYTSEAPTGTVTFYAAAADFRGRSRDTSRVEVYVGVPVEEVAPTDEGWQGERTVVVYNRAWQEVHRSVERSPLPIPSGLREEVLDEVRLDLPPGDYFMAVKVKDLTSRRTQTFREGLHVGGYGEDSLRVSGIELARQIAPAKGEGRFVKGDLRVIPMPSRTFGKSQNVNVYFEVYNLRQDAQGQTHFRVDYTVKGQKEGSGIFSLTGLGRLIGKSEQGGVVTVSYDLAGKEAQDAVHTALDVSGGGAGDFTLQVTVTDLNSGMVASRKTTFTVK
ncbi:MAG: tetratricopeptide repeat protein [Candidatus Latescibacteria bacterium]|nr:tetratricopeptide repeat protein [Candidatus Latescibacterota bacterium]